MGPAKSTQKGTTTTCVCVRAQANTCAHTTHASGSSRARNAKYLPLLQAQMPPPHPQHTHTGTHTLQSSIKLCFFKKKKLFCHSSSGDECRHLFFWSAAVSLVFARRSAGCRCLWIRARFFWEGEQTLEQQPPPPYPPATSLPVVDINNHPMAEEQHSALPLSTPALTAITEKRVFRCRCRKKKREKCPDTP